MNPLKDVFKTMNEQFSNLSGDNKEDSHKNYDDGYMYCEKCNIKCHDQDIENVCDNKKIHHDYICTDCLYEYEESDAYQETKDSMNMDKRI